MVGLTDRFVLQLQTCTEPIAASVRSRRTAAQARRQRAVASVGRSNGEVVNQPSDDSNAVDSLHRIHKCRCC